MVKWPTDEEFGLEIDELNNTITIPRNCKDFDYEELEDFKFFKNIKSSIKKPFNIWFTSDIGYEWYINFLIFDGKIFLQYKTDDINDFILTLDEDSDSYDDDRGDILGDINCGELDEEDYPKIPEDINNPKYYEYRILK